VSVVALAIVWSLTAVVARRLPPGLARDLVRLVPSYLSMLRRLRRDPRVPRAAKLAVLAAGVWIASPIDLVPEFLPVIGLLDDVIVMVLCLRFAARRVPRHVLLEAWPGDPTPLKRLLNRRHASEAADAPTEAPP
jgi:uncharacterized membrane protein YkvA (DUF1232 family)